MNMKIAIALFASTFLAGCMGSNTRPDTTQAFPDNPQNSRALNVMLAAGTMKPEGEIYDVEIERSAAVGQDVVDGVQRREVTDAAFDLVDAADGISVLAGFRAPPIGVSGGFHGGMMLLSLLDSPYKPSFVYNHYVAFMPASMASSPDDARVKMLKMFSDASLASLPEGTTYRKYTDKWKPLIGKGERELIIVNGGTCDESFVTVYGDVPEPSGCKLTVGMTGNPEPIIAPSWLGGEPAYLFRPDLYKDENSAAGSLGAHLWVEAGKSYGILDSIRREEMLKAKMGTLAPAERMLQISKLLPEWVYGYIAPTKKDPIPKIVNQGQVYYFAKYRDVSAEQIVSN